MKRARAEWRRDPAWSPRDRRGRLWVWRSLPTPPLGNDRDVWVYRPAGVADVDPLPILVFQDGQNLFASDASFSGTHWRVPETLSRLAREGRPAMAVGVANAGRRRMAEYGPFLEPARRGGSTADRYLEALTKEVLPRVEERFGVVEQRAGRAILGSSMGGLLALYGFFAHPNAFGLCAALSPSLQVRKQSVFRFLGRVPPPSDGRLYLDVGTREVSRPRGRRWNSRHYSANATALRDLLRRRGFRLGRDLCFVRETGGRHHESAWARRLPGALRFLLGGPCAAGRPGGG